jgi:hypothetical protein
VNEPFRPGQRIEFPLRAFNEDHKLAKFLPPLPYNVQPRCFQEIYEARVLVFSFLDVLLCLGFIARRDPGGEQDDEVYTRWHGGGRVSR